MDNSDRRRPHGENDDQRSLQPPSCQPGTFGKSILICFSSSVGDPQRNLVFSFLLQRCPLFMLDLPKIFIVFHLHESPSRPQMCSTDCDILEINHNFTFHTCHSLLMLNVIPISSNVTTCHTLLLMWDYWFCQLIDQLSEVCSSNGFVPQTSGQTQIYHSSCRGLGCCCNI